MAIAVIGTGLAGLACAHALSEGGESVTLFDKSLGYGGRMASRRQADFAFDHGLPAFDPVGAETIPALDALPEWNGHGRVAAPRMNAFPRAIGQRFDSRMGTAITRINPHGLTLTDDSGTRHDGFSKIVVAIPAPQAAALLGEDDARFAALADVTYTPCCTLMLGGVADAGKDVMRLEPNGGPIALLIRDDAKPGHPSPARCYVAHATVEWSQANLHREKDAIAQGLAEAFAALTGFDPASALYRAGHRWRYCQTAQTVPAPFLLSQDGRIGACGDWCGVDRSGGDARAAWHSGVALGRALLA